MLFLISGMQCGGSHQNYSVVVVVVVLYAQLLSKFSQKLADRDVILIGSGSNSARVQATILGQNPGELAQPAVLYFGHQCNQSEFRIFY